MTNAALSLACAMMLNPGIAETAAQSPHDPMPIVIAQDASHLSAGFTVDRHGRARDINDAIALYEWRGPGVLRYGNMTGLEQMAHEMVHHLQYRSGVNPGAPDSQERRDVERVAYETERLARFECLTIWGNWDVDKLAPFVRKIAKKSFD